MATTEFDIIRKALKRARRLARIYRRGGLQDFLTDTQAALAALDSLEERSKPHQLGLWQERPVTQQLGDDNG